MIDVLFAQAAGAQAGGPMTLLLQFLPFILVIVIFYFLLIRPQSQRQKALREMVEKMAKGDRVVTSGGLYGEVVDVKEKTVILKVADNVKMEFTKQSVVSMESKRGE